MSTYYKIRCRTCDVDVWGHYRNTAAPLLWVLANQAELIAALGMIESMPFEFGDNRPTLHESGALSAATLRAHHEGHDLRVFSEHGTLVNVDGAESTEPG